MPRRVRTRVTGRPPTREQRRQELASALAKVVRPQRTIRHVGIGNKIYRFHRTTDGGQITSINSRFIQQVNVPTYNGVYFKLSDLPNYAEFTALFDQYRITRISISFLPMSNCNILSAITSSDTGNPGIFGTVLDFDDANAPTTLAELQQYQTFSYQPAVTRRVHRRSFKPRIASAVYAGAFTSFANMKDIWIDVASPNVQYYGLKYYMDQYDAITTPQIYQVMATYYVQFRQVR